MNQYTLTFINQFKLGLEYRGGFFIFAIVSIVPTIASIFLWIFIFSTTEITSELTKDEMVVYFFLVDAFLIFLAPRLKFISDGIRTGELSNVLVKPTSVLLYYFGLTVGYSFSKNAIKVILNLFIALVYSLYSGVNLEFYNLLLVIILIPFITILNYSFFSIFGMLAFWTTDNSAFLQIISNFGNLVSGRWIPLFFLPQVVQALIKILPFQYFIYFPVMVILGKVSYEQYMQGFFFIIVQILIYSLITYFLYLKGIKKYEGYGI